MTKESYQISKSDQPVHDCVKNAVDTQTDFTYYMNKAVGIRTLFIAFNASYDVID